MTCNGNPSISLQKSMPCPLKDVDISPPSQQSLDARKSCKLPLKISTNAAMLSKVTISSLKTQNPQIAHLFESNYAPSDAEREVIHKNLDAAKSERLKYRRMEPPGRHSYGQQSRIFVHNMQQIDTTITYWKSLLVPIRRIPPEILCHIFSFVLNLPQERPAEAYRRRLCVNGPLLLLHICRLWRRLASSTSPLWRRLPDIFLEEVKSNLIEGRLALLMKHSGLAKHDLAVSIGGREEDRNRFWAPEPGSHWESNPRLLIDFLCQTSHLWSECTMASPITSLECLSMIKGNTPNLRKLTLSFNDGSNQLAFLGSTASVDLFEHAPLLENLYLVGAHDGRISVPINQLSHLKDHSLGHFASSRLFQHPIYPNLVYLELTDRHADYPTMLQFPRLRHFQIECQMNIEMGCLPRAIFPSLLKLVVHAIEGSSGDVLGVIERAIRRSDCIAIESLSVYCTHSAEVYHPQSSFMCLLEATSNLSHLDFIANPVDIQDLTAFFRREDKASPKIQSCSIHVASPIRSDTAAAIQKLSLCWQEPGRSLDISSLSCGGSKTGTLKICPYKSASLCDPPQRPMATPAMLENWFSDPRRSILHELSTKLRGSNNGKIVCAMEPVLQIWSHLSNSRLEFANSLTEVELYNPQNANEILNADVHFVIARLAARSIPSQYWEYNIWWHQFFYIGNPLHGFRDQLFRILKKWHKILMKESLDDKHWIWSTSSNELYYVPDSASARKDKKRWAATILGMPGLYSEKPAL